MARVGRGVGIGQATRRPVLVDTSLWIRYFQPTGWEELKRELAQLLDWGSLLTCWVVKAELLVGARDATAFDCLLKSLRALEEVALTPEIWESAARLGHSLRQRGFSVPLPALLIAQAAVAADAELWHADSHFDRIREVCSVNTRCFVETGESPSS